MEVKVIEERENMIKIEFRDKDKHTIPNLLCWELNKNEKVLMAGYRVEHPLKDKVEIIVKVKEGNPKEIIKETIENINKRLEAFLKEWSRKA